MSQAALRTPSLRSVVRPRERDAYALVVCCVLGLGLTRWYVPILGAGAAGMLLALVPAVLCAWRGGSGPGLTAALLSVVTVALVRPYAIQPITDPAALLPLALLLGLGVAISGLAEKAHRARAASEAARAAAESAEHRGDVLLDSMRDWAVIILDSEGRIRSWNKGATRLFGHRPEDVVGRHVCRLFTGQSMQFNAPEREMRHAAEFGRFEGQDWRVRADGSHFRAHSVTVPIRDSRAEMSGFLVTAYDITDREREETELRASLAELRDLARHLHATRESERARIAREMHDELGQSLACLKMDVAALLDVEADGPELPETCARLRERVDGAIRSMRRLVSELRPRVLDDLGLTAAIEWQAQEFQSRTGIRCEIEEPLPEVTLDRERSGALFRIFQEALTNVARHSGATGVQVSLREGDEGISLVVRDNGRGVSEAEVATKRSMGLLGMRERALAFGGTVNVSGVAGQGTAVSAHLPTGTGTSRA